jgi:hypothetical protein
VASCNSLGPGIVLSIGMLLVNSPILAADCAQGDALACYTQALVRLQAAEDALGAARKDIGALQTSIGLLTASVAQANAQIATLTAQITQTNARTVTWDKGNQQYDPPAGQPPFNGVNGAGTAGPPQPFPHCNDGYVAVGL